MRFSKATLPSTMASSEWDLFFCYNRRENSSVAHVRSLLLERYGITGWMDQKSLPGSTDFENEILTLIDTCANCAVVLGSDGWGEYQKGVELPAILKRKQADPNFNIFLVLLPGADERHLELVDASYRRKHWIDLRTDISNTDAIWSLAAGVRPTEQNPEDRLHVLRYHLNSMAERWDSGGRKEHSLLYRGQLLADSQQAIASGADTLPNATRDFLSESKRRQRYEVRVRRLAKAAAVLIATLVVGTLGWLAWTRTDRFQVQTIVAAADSDLSQLDLPIIQGFTTTLFETNHVAEAERMIQRLPLPADQLSVIDITLRTLAEVGDSRHSEELVSAALARIPAVEDKELHSRTLSSIVESLLKLHNIDRAVSLSEQIDSERDRATVSVSIARAMAERGRTSDAARFCSSALDYAKRNRDAALYCDVARVYLTLGDPKVDPILDNAASAARTIDSPNARASQQTEIASLLCRTRRFGDAEKVGQEALTSTHHIGDWSFRATELEQAAATLAEAGLRPLAKEAAHEALHPPLRSTAAGTPDEQQTNLYSVVHLAELLLSRTDTDIASEAYQAAVRTASRAGRPGVQLDLRIAMLEALTRERRFAEASEAAVGIDQSACGNSLPGRAKAELLTLVTCATTRTAILEAFRKWKHPLASAWETRAVDAARAIPDPQLRFKALTSILPLLNADGGTRPIDLVHDALDAAGKLPGETGLEALLQVVETVVTSGLLDADAAVMAAYREQQRLSIDELPARTLARLAQLLAQIHRPGEALEVTQRAANAAANTTDERERSAALAEVASTLALLKRLREARLTADGCSFADDRFTGYISVLQAYSGAVNK